MERFVADSHRQTGAPSPAYPGYAMPLASPDLIGLQLYKMIAAPQGANSMTPVVFQSASSL
jgi:hypothetical protein